MIKRQDNSIIEIKNGYERILIIAPPHGAHGLEFRYLVRKDDKAVQFVLWAPIYLKSKQKDHTIHETFGVDVGYHSPYPMYEAQEPISDKDCPFIGKPCYYDGSGLRGLDWEEIWLNEGSDSIWSLLEEEWSDRFASKETEEKQNNKEVL